MTTLETVKGIYKRLAVSREPYLRRAEESALLTIPSLFPKKGLQASADLPQPYQSLGARGLNNLASLILLAIFPPNTPFYRLDIKLEEMKELRENNSPDILTKVQEELGQRERVILKYHEAKQYRVTIGEGIKQLLVAGNYCYFQPPGKQGGIKGYRLDHYVVERDGLGEPFRIITLDTLTYASLEDKYKSLLKNKGERKPDSEIEVYTHVYLEGDFFSSYQELEGTEVPGTRNKFPKNKSPWTPIRMIKMSGENYARGYVEEHIGDLRSYEGLSKALLDYSAIASEIKFLVNPTGMTQARRLNNAKNGDYVSGRKDDVSTLTLDKYNDLRVVKEQLAELKTDISLAFLLNSAVQRNAERVTAEEIRYVARELENGIGGIYSILSQELQLPIVMRSIAQMQSIGILEDFKDAVEPSIITGISALGRGQDLDKLEQFLGYATQLPEGASYLKTGNLLKIIGTGLSLDIDGAIKSDEEFQQYMEQMQQMELQRQATTPLVNGAVQAGLNEQQQGGKQ